MGTYTTHYNLFMPTVGEQGWGDLVNGNFTTIDTTMAGLNTRLTAVENEVNGNLSCTSVTTSGTITSTGKITANGGIGTKALTATSISNSGALTQTGASTFTGLITANGGIKGNLTGNMVGGTNGFLYVSGTVGTSGDELYADCKAQSGGFGDTTTYTANITVNDYAISYGNPHRHTWGVYTRRSDLSGTTAPSIAGNTRTLTLKNTYSASNTYWVTVTCSDLGWNGTTLKGDDVWPYTGTLIAEVEVGKTYSVKVATNSSGVKMTKYIHWSIPAENTVYYVTYDTP